MRLLLLITIVISTLLLTVNSNGNANKEGIQSIDHRSNSLVKSPFEIRRRHRQAQLRESLQIRSMSNLTKADELDDDDDKEIMSTVVKRRHKYRGKATFYHGGAMACGGSREPGQIFAAMSTEMFQGGKRCGSTVTVKDRRNHRKVTVTILDECPGCARTQLDLSQGAFDVLGSENTGVLHIKWWFD